MRVEQDDITSLIIPVPEAAFVQPFRVKYLQRPSVTMPPHVTLHAPFKLRSAMDQKVLSALAQLFAAQGQFRFTLARTVRFSETGVFYLTPEPAEPFLALSRAIQAQYPDRLSDHPRPIVHLTLALSNSEGLDDIETEFHRVYGGHLPVKAVAREVSLYERHGNAWVKSADFGLAHNGMSWA
jgi:2'-5' RNA ligase